MIGAVALELASYLNEIITSINSLSGAALDDMPEIDGRRLVWTLLNAMRGHTHASRILELALQGKRRNGLTL